MRSTTELDTRVAALAVAADHDAALAGLRDKLLAEIVAAPLEGPAVRTPRAWFRRPVVVLGSLTALAASTAFAVVALQPRANDLTSTECRYGQGDVVIPATTGDPVADCTAQWSRDNAGPAPAMVAYAQRGRSVLVVTAGEPVPAGFQPLAPGRSQNTAVIELDEALGSYVDGLSSRCFTAAEAVTAARADLARLGLAGWQVQTQTGSGACVGYVGNDPVARTVLLRPGDDELPAGSETATLAAALRTAEASCTDLSTTAAAVRTAAGSLGWTEANHGLTLTLVPTPGATCTRIYYEAGGSALITLRGPQG